MSASSHPQVTQLLQSLSDGDDQSVQDLLPLVYNELRGLAHRELKNERAGHTLNTTALVHEAYLKLVKSPPAGEWAGKKHFFMIAAHAMRQILINYARSRKAEKRGGDQDHASFEESMYMSHEKAGDLLELDQALKRLEEWNERQSKVVECRYFGGFNIEETAEILDVSTATVKRDWISAKAWLYQQIRGK